jgi:ABC-type dipeptide/oligopeptide/nickel transport system permease component
MVVWMYRHDIHWFRVIASDDLKSLILPFFLLSLIPTNYISRITTVAIEKQQNKKFVMIAKAKGLKRSAILLVHIMKNAVIEVLGAFPSMFIILISCQVLVEYMFAYPGLAYMMFSSGGEEEAVIGASFLLVSFYYIFVLLVDLTKYGFSPYKKTGVLADSVLELALEADEKEAYDD